MNIKNIKEIDFQNSKISEKEFKFGSEIKVESPKTIAYVVRWQLARNRSGSAKTKTMAEISGTTAKPWKQKGTGRARQGSKRSVQFVGGRTCHGPMPRSFDFSIPKNIAKTAKIDAIKYKILNDKIYTYSELNNFVNTSKISKFLNQNNIASLLIIHNDNSKIIESARNIKNIKLVNHKAINTLDILNYDCLLVEKEIFSNKILGEIK
ncbi:MAG: 50S ribosomal protein L4 [Rickettsiales bacterium]